MPRFPKKEADIVALAERLWRGLWSNRPIYPQPTIHPIFLRWKAIMYLNDRNNLLTAKATVEQAIAEKDEALENLIDALKADIRYAENTVNYDDAKLKLLGWAGKKTATVLTPPGQARLLEAPKQGKGWLFLDWKAPVDGGKPAAIAAQAAAEEATGSKDEALDDLVDAMRSDLRYAENTVDFDDDKLKLIGWAGRKAKTPLAVPGQVRLLEAPKQGAGWVFLDWKAPVDGGAPAAYKVMRRERPAGPWEDVATAVITEATLVEQPTGKELEYRIIAVNKAGDGEPSNTAMVVL